MGRWIVACAAAMSVIGCWQPLEATKAWTTPTNISDNTSNNPDVAMNATSQAVAVWHDFGVSSMTISAADRSTAGAWSPPVPVSSDDLANFPLVAISPTGYAVAAWTSVTGSAHQVFAAHAAFGGTWSTPVQLSNPSTTLNAGQIAVSIDANSNAVVAWWTPATTGYRIAAATLPFGLSPSPEVLIDVSDEPSAVAVGFDGSGNATIIYQKDDDGTNVSDILAQTLPAANLDDGGPWVNPVVISEDAPFQHSWGDVSLSVNTSGQAIAAWLQDLSGTDDSEAVWGNVLVGGAWQTAQSFTPSGEDADADIVTALNAAGTGVIAWTIPFKGIDSVEAVIWPVTGTAGDSFIVSDPSAAEPAASPSVAIDSAGDIFILWSQSDGTFDRILAYMMPAVGSPSTVTLTPSTNPDEDGDATSPVVAVDGSGDAVAVWAISLDAATNFYIQSANYQLTTPPPPSGPNPPTDFVGTSLHNRFLTQTDLIHHLTWVASSSSDVVDYLLYRNGELIATIPATDPLVYNDHRRGNNTDTYELFALNSSDALSTGVTLVVGP